MNDLINRKFCVYTTLLGDYEELNEQPVVEDSQINFICFTDNKKITSRTWKIQFVEPVFPFDLARSSRIYKICPHRYLKEYNTSLYIDNSIVLKMTPEAIFNELMRGKDVDMVCSRHSYRDTVIDEFIAVAALQYDDLNLIMEQLNAYFLTNPKILDEKPFKGGFLIRNHHNQDVIDTMEIWLAHVLRYSRRDQLSMNYALRTGNIKIGILDVDFLDSKYFQWPVVSGRNQKSYKQNIFLSSSLLGKIAQNEQRIQELEAMARELEGIKGGLTWKSTEPFRRFRTWLRTRRKLPE